MTRQPRLEDVTCDRCGRQTTRPLYQVDAPNGWSQIYDHQAGEEITVPRVMSQFSHFCDVCTRAFEVWLREGRQP